MKPLIRLKTGYARLVHYLEWVGFICLFVLSGCAFQAFSTKILAKYLPVVRIQSEQLYDEMNNALVKRLRAQGIKVLIGNEAPTEQVPILMLTTNFIYNTFSSLHSTAARIYNTSYNTKFALLNKHPAKTTWYTVTVTRDILLQPNEMFEVTSQVSAIKREMCDQMVRKLVQIIILQYEKQTDANIQTTTN